MKKIIPRIFVTVMLGNIALAGCTVVRIGEPYDQNIDDQINAYHKQAVEFIKTMEQLAGKKGGEFDSEAARKFYAQTDASLQNIQVQADTLSKRVCSIKFDQKLKSEAKKTEIQRSEEQQSKVINVSSLNDNEYKIGTNCVSIVVHNIILAQRDLELDHKALNKISSIVARLNQAQIDAAVRVALTTLRAKKY